MTKITVINEQSGPLTPLAHYSQDQGYQPPIDLTEPDPNGPFTSEAEIKQYGLDGMYQNGVKLTISQAIRVMQKRFAYAPKAAKALFEKLNEKSVDNEN